MTRQNISFSVFREHKSCCQNFFDKQSLLQTNLFHHDYTRYSTKQWRQVPKPKWSWTYSHLQNRFTCVACWQHNITNIVHHRSQHCKDWNALNRINCGFHQQWTEGRASFDASGSYTTKPYILKGEHYRMVKGQYGVQPHHIMRW